MEIIVRDTLCPHHPDEPVDIPARLRAAVLDGTLGEVTVITGTLPTKPVHEPDTPVPDPSPWSAAVKYVVQDDPADRTEALADKLRHGSGSVLILDCSCEIRPGILSAFANLVTATVLVSDRAHLVQHRRVRATAHQVGRLALALDGLGPEGELAYLGTLFLTGADRALLRDILAEDGFRLSWPGTVCRLAARIHVQCAAQSRDIHGKDVVVGGALAGGSHARTYIRFDPASGRRTVRKEAVGAGREKLTDEIVWLHGLETAAGRHFPDVIESRIEPYGVSMDLAYHHLPTLRRLILSGEIDEEEAARWARRTLATLRRDLYPVGPVPAPDDYVRRTHLDRIRSRLVETAAAVPARWRLWNAAEVRVNGVPLRGIQQVADALADDRAALELLAPDRLVRTHGDPHFDNILIDRHNHRFFLIDPRGNSGYDIAYDLGKIWHSVNSLYDLIHDGHVEVEAGDDRIDYAFTSPRLVAFYHGVRERLRDWLVASDWSQGDPHWFLKVRLAEAAHMCSVMPFHIVRGRPETVAIACYARGLELINSLYEDVMAETTARLVPGV
ncbi:phosphotransferase [Streptomyces sp. NPDC057617]|uniref:phosphotransferase n=1 Tax=Streptomyces sp. NPDC057617 TaxID=3346184 RepID=UPI0036BD22C7